MMPLPVFDTGTALYCVLGRPVGHSKSPAIHNSAFRKAGVNAVYLAFEPSSIEQAVKAMRSLSIQGASVTIPFKERVMAHLDWVAPLAQQIGAVNTIVNDNGMLKGYNTDCRAAIDPILFHGGLNGKRVCVVGAGGAARAVVHGAANEGAKIIVTNRTQDKGRRLAQEVGGQFVPPEKAADIHADVVINTTSIGMHPKTNAISFPETALRPEMVVMDVVYTPVETRLLNAASARGCAVIDGATMFIAQAAAQFKLWTGMDPDIELMRQEIVKTSP